MQRRFVEEARLMQNSLNLQENREVKSLRIGLSEVVNGFFSDKLEQFLIPELQSAGSTNRLDTSNSGRL